MKFSHKKLPKSQVTIEVQLAPEEVGEYRTEAMARLAKGVRLEGFRPGHVPLAVAERHLEESKVGNEAAKLAMAKAYETIVREERIDAIGEPEIQVLKLAPGNPLEFRIQVAVLPEVDLPDYKKIAGQSAKKKVSVEPKEVDEAFEWLQKSRKTPAESPQGSQAGSPESGKVSLGGKNQASINPDDNFARSVGNFTSLAELRQSIQEGLRHEKEMREKDRVRQEIIEKVAEHSRLQIPEVLVEREKRALLSQVTQGVIQTLQMTFAEYLQQVGKTEQEILDSLEAEAEQRVKRFLVLREVAKREAISPTQEEIEQEANAILKHLASVPKAKQDLDPDRLKEYTEGVLRHEKTLQFLEQFVTTSA